MAGNFEFKAVEKEIKQFWKKNKTYDKVREKNESGPKFFFMDGPPYTSGKIHLGQAWNKALKDAVLRYKRMTGHNVFDRACYDMHGLPTARAVMKKHGLEFNEDIEKFGIEKFTKECKKWSIENAKAMDNDFAEMGAWLDFSNPLYPIDNDFIEGCWNLIKTVHEQDRLYEGQRPIAWSPMAETALAKHELEYKEVTDKSIFVKFKIKGTKNEYLIIWTTTPWTIPYNLAIMAHPDFDYIKVDINGEKWILAKELAHNLIEINLKEELIIAKEMKGKELEGLEYIHPLIEIIPALKEIKKDHKKTHTVLMTNQYVDLNAGSGLVHCAPGCGPEDYEVGHLNNLPAFNEVDSKGVFSKIMGQLSGRIARTDDTYFIEILEDNNALVFKKKYKHDYPHCERTHAPVIYRTTKQWFFKVEDLKEEMIKLNKDVSWNPQTGKNSFNGWLEHLRDNSITKQNIWGTPLPIWRCDKSDYFEVIGSVQELKEKGAKKIPKDLHKPYIDEVTWKSPNGGTMRRLPDILDVWIDAGMLPFNVVDYQKDDSLFNSLFPGDFIVEGTDQIRGWFNILLVCSMLMKKGMPFQNVYMHGMITAVDGEKMSKSLGNIISPNELFDKNGIDSSRAYLTATPPGPDKNFSWDELELIHRDFNVIWNTQNYLLELIKLNNIKLDDVKIENISIEREEKYILSKLHSTIKNVTESFETYKVNETIKPVTKLLLELSRNYIKYVREKAASGTEKEKITIAWIIKEVLYNAVKILSPNCPFFCEKVYQNLKPIGKWKTESIHLYEWPEYNSDLINEGLEESIIYADRIIQGILSLRKKTERGIKWPYNNVLITLNDKNQKKEVKLWSDLIKEQTNIKKLEIIDKFKDLESNFELNMKTIGPKFGKDSRVIVTKLLEMDQKTILKKLEKDEKIILKLDQNYELEKEDFKIHYEVKEPYIKAEIIGGNIYLDKTVNEKLELEGYAREIVRTIQSMRKESGFVKSDRIELKIDTDLKGNIKDLIESNKSKLGFEKLTFKANKGKKISIKEKEITIEIQKV